MSLKIRRLSEEPGIEEEEEGYSGVNSVWLVLKRGDLTGFSSRIFRIEPGGHTPMHSHEREHVAVVIRGVCLMESMSQSREVGEGFVATVPSGVAHRFSNPGKERLVLLLMNLFTEGTERKAP